LTRWKNSAIIGLGGRPEKTNSTIRSTVIAHKGYGSIAKCEALSKLNNLRTVFKSPGLANCSYNSSLKLEKMTENLKFQVQAPLDDWKE